MEGGNKAKAKEERLALKYRSFVGRIQELSKTSPNSVLPFLFFVFYLGYFCSRVLFLDVVRGSTAASLLYTGLGFVLIILALISLLFSPKQGR